MAQSDRRHRPQHTRTGVNGRVSGGNRGGKRSPASSARIRPRMPVGEYPYKGTLSDWRQFMPDEPAPAPQSPGRKTRFWTDPDHFRCKIMCGDSVSPAAFLPIPPTRKGKSRSSLQTTICSQPWETTFRLARRRPGAVALWPISE